MGIFKNRKKTRICFVHVPKCGGQSIKRAFEDSYKANLKTMGIRARSSFVGSTLNTKYELSHQEEENLQNYREGILRYFLADRDYGLIMGHYRGGKKTVEFYKDDWSFVTILRDPVERFYSNYYYNRYKKSDHFKLDASLEEFVESDQARLWGNILVRYFSDDPNEYNSKVGILEAQKTLQQYEIVGLLENLDDFSQKCASLLKRRMKIKIINQNPVDSEDSRRKVSDRVQEKVIELCQPSIQVYEFAKEINCN